MIRFTAKDAWIHRRCAGLSSTNFKILNEAQWRSDQTFFCLYCELWAGILRFTLGFTWEQTMLYVLVFRRVLFLACQACLNTYTLSAIMEDALTNRKPLMMTFLLQWLEECFRFCIPPTDFWYAGSSESTTFFIEYVQSFYSQLFVILRVILGKLTRYLLNEVFFRETHSLL